MEITPVILRIILSILFMLPVCAWAADNEELTPEQKEYLQWAKDIWDSLDRRSGDITLPETGATLHVPEQFYYLNPGDSEKILTEVWENPPGSKTLGMLFPTGVTPFDGDSWGVTITYEEDGYVSDKDAKKIDYNELLAEMQEDTKAASEKRAEKGYGSIELVGWASPPYYDAVSHKLHWAKELKFENQEVNTLNYNIRILGRKGVLVLNFIAGIDQKEVITSVLDSVLAMAEFDQGSRYQDFNPKLDKVAAYGIGALIAGKMIAKTGFLTGALVLFKKFGVFLIVGIGVFIKKLFGRKEA